MVRKKRVKINKRFKIALVSIAVGIGFVVLFLGVDLDGDGLSNFAELQYGTSMFNSDTDSDGLDDGQEIQLCTNPFNVDTDGDGLEDGDEINIFGTDPLVADTDKDGLNDGQELELGTDPLNADSDRDGLDDVTEVRIYRTDPNDSDSDSDGLDDWEEIHTFNTDPSDADSDEDGLNDYEEVVIYRTDPCDSDTDDDGILDSSDQYPLYPIPEGYYNHDLYDEWGIERRGHDFDALKYYLRFGYYGDLYERGDFDCSDMSAYIEWKLTNLGFEAEIVVSSMHNHAWVITHTSDPYTVAVEATSAVKVGSSGIRYSNTTYYISGSRIDYYNDYDIVLSDIEEACDRYGGTDQSNWWDEVSGGSPSKLVLSDLSISPSTIDAGGQVTASVTLTNIGDRKGSWEVELKVGGNTVESQDATLDGGSSTSLTFTFSETTPGDFTVEIGDLSTVLTVRLPRGWHEVDTFTGADDITTPTFDIPANQFRIYWRAESDSYFPYLSYFVYKEGEIMYVDRITHHEAGSGVDEVTDGNGSFYIKVYAANLDSWTLVIAAPD